jgi:hypothetical protein
MMSNPPQPDRAEIVRAVRRIAAPGQVVELRALNVAPTGRRPYTLSGYFDDPERLAIEAARILKAQGVYMTLNPPNPAVLARCANRVRVAGAGAATSDNDIIVRRWLPIDADPIRPAEISASEAEHEAALDAARRIRRALAELGWPEPLFADSGNGGHLLYRIDLPATDLTHRAGAVSAGLGRPVSSGGVVERVLAALAASFDDERVRVDLKVFNPARIWKLYGTVARKGDDTPDRPHRLARLLEGPEEVQVVPREMLEETARLYDCGLPTADLNAPNPQSHMHRPRTVNPQSSIRNPQFSLDSWLVEHNVPVEAARPWQDGRRWIFPACPWNPEHLRSAYVVELPNGAIAAGCLHNSCTGKGWQDLRRLYDCGLRIADSKTKHPRSSASNPQVPQGAMSGNPQFAPGTDTQSAIDDPQSAIADPQSAIAEIASWPIVTTRAGRPEAEARATELIGRCAELDRAGLLQAAAALRGRGLGSVFVRQWLSALRQRQRRLEAASAAPEPPAYEAEDGRIYRVAWELGTGGEPQPRRTVVADFALRIVEETVAEDGRVWFTLEGEAADGRPLRLELTSAEFADDRMLQAAVTAAAGPCCPVRANMLRHLRPAIQLLTPAEVPRSRRYDRTGWMERSNVETLERSNVETFQPSLAFLLPGREPPGIVVRLPRKLPYRAGPDSDLDMGLLALEAALNAADPRRTTVLLAAMLGAPLARRAGLEGERYGIFLSGRTGSLKTSTAQVLMCLYGAGFIEDQYLLKMGEGATRNAIMGYASHVHDLPFLVDNFKPSTGDGARGFVSLLHNLLEGGDRERLTRTAELRESRPVHCWPIFTGEDVPDADTAALARLLILPLEPPKTLAKTLRVSETLRSCLKSRG